MTKPDNIQQSANHIGDFIKALFPLNTKDIIEIQKKNFDLIGKIQQKATDNLQAIGQKQRQIFSRTVENQANLAQELLDTKHPFKEKMLKQAEVANEAIIHTLEEWSDLSALINESSKETYELIGQQASAILSEIKSDIKSK